LIGHASQYPWAAAANPDAHGKHVHAPDSLLCPAAYSPAEQFEHTPPAHATQLDVGRPACST
jgi:hypothetical protein